MTLLRLAPFAFATLLPAALLAAACVRGAPWAWAAIVVMTILVHVLDKIEVSVPASGRDGHRLSETLGMVHFGLLGMAVWAMGGMLPTLDKTLILMGCGLYFGQISNSNAHELIHRANRWAFRLGAANYAAVLFGHHTSAHRLVHHVHAATSRDPATARCGEGFWAYLPRAWAGSFHAGLRAERQLRGGVNWPAPYIAYGAGACLSLMVSVALSGAAGLAGLIAIAALAQIQLMLSDYVQHYGLEREILPDGSNARMSAVHSWNAPHWYSSAMLLNAPHHSAHHTKPADSFPQLELDAQNMPMLPYSLPVMAAIALVPPLWRKIMDPRTEALRTSRADGNLVPAFA
jgi:alkane 1-monooxygenase